MQNDYSKSARCKLAGVAHERQLAVALEKLYETAAAIFPDESLFQAGLDCVKKGQSET